MGNIYYLVLYNQQEFEIEVGSLGIQKFRPGWYGYVGSSKSDDFKRLTRHREISKGINDTKHWHIDYLNGSNYTTSIGAYISRDIEECQLSNSIELSGINQFGSSDCSCQSHLHYNPSFEDFFEVSRDGFNQITTEYSWVDIEKFDKIN